MRFQRWEQPRPQSELAAVKTFQTKVTKAYGDFSATGQVTVVEWRGWRAFVRENCRRLSVDHFTTSSNARLRTKQGGVGTQVLELAAPADIWDRLAAVVEASDTHHRPVVRSQSWTLDVAEAAFEQGNAQ